MGELGLGDVGAAVYAEERHELVTALPAALFEPTHEISGLLVKTDGDQGVESEGGVPEPGVAIVPVALLSNGLRQFGSLSASSSESQASGYSSPR
jgi:hypothetical protein